MGSDLDRRDSGLDRKSAMIENGGSVDRLSFRVITPPSRHPQFGILLESIDGR